MWKVLNQYSKKRKPRQLDHEVKLKSGIQIHSHKIYYSFGISYCNPNYCIFASKVGHIENIKAKYFFNLGPHFIVYLQLFLSTGK